MYSAKPVDTTTRNSLTCFPGVIRVDGRAGCRKAHSRDLADCLSETVRRGSGGVAPHWPLGRRAREDEGRWEKCVSGKPMVVAARRKQKTNRDSGKRKRHYRAQESGAEVPRPARSGSGCHDRDEPAGPDRARECPGGEAVWVPAGGAPGAGD